MLLLSSIVHVHALKYMDAMEAMTSVALVLALGSLQKFPIDFQIFQRNCSLQNENGLKDEIPGLLVSEVKP